MTLSEAVQKYKNRGNSRDRALRRAKERVEKAGEAWTPGKQQIFDNVWTGHTVIDVPARVPRGTKKVIIGKPPKTTVHTPKVVPEIKDPGLQDSKQPDAQQETGALGQLQKEYARMSVNTSIQAATTFYLKLWHYFNTKHFHQYMMPVPVFRYLKDMGKRFGCRAHYMPSKNQLSFSKRLFNANFEDFNNTFVHEMCHQAVHCIDDSKGYRTPKGRRDIHGAPWQKWMRHCGLTPQRCDMLDNTNYMTESEKKEHLDKVETKKAQLVDKKQIQPGMNKPARFYSPDRKQWFVGMIVCPNDAKAKRWVFIDKTWGTDYKIVPSDWFYEIEESYKESLAKPQWTAHADDLRTKLMVHKQNKQEMKQLKKLYRSGYRF